MGEKSCPCKAMEDLQKKVDDQEKQLAKGETQFAVINTKLNLIMWVLATVGAAVIGVAIKLVSN